MKITLLGTAAGIPTARRFNTSFCVGEGDNLYLFDAGDGVAGLCAKQGINLSDINAVFISHTHVDHIGGLAMLIQTMQLTRRTKDLTVFMPEEGIPGMKTYFNAIYLMDDLLPFKLNLEPIPGGGVFFHDEHMRVAAYPNTHLMVKYEELKDKYPVKGQSHSFRIESGDTTVVYSGDIRSLEEVFPALGDGACAVILECSHYPLDAKLAALNGRVDTLIITHIHHEMDMAGKKIKTDIKKYYNGNVIVGEDMMEIGIEP